MKNSNARYRIAIGMTLFALLLAWWLIPGVNEFMQRSLAAFATLDQQAIERFIDSGQAALVSFALMILQAIIAPLPAFLITFANASLFGAFWGGAVVGERDGRRGAVLLSPERSAATRWKSSPARAYCRVRMAFLPATANTPY
jgi:hypothetical protein